MSIDWILTRCTRRTRTPMSEPAGGDASRTGTTARLTLAAPWMTAFLLGRLAGRRVLTGRSRSERVCVVLQQGPSYRVMRTAVPAPIVFLPGSPRGSRGSSAWARGERSAQAEEGQYRDDDDDRTNQVNDAVHFGLLGCTR